MPYDWGLVSARGLAKNDTCTRALKLILTRLEPEMLVLEAFEPRCSSRSPRIAALCRDIIAIAGEKGIGVRIYTRQDIERCFGGAVRETRDGIAEAVARQLQVLSHRRPTARRPWESEDRRMALFTASALVLTYFSGGRG